MHSPKNRGWRGLCPGLSSAPSEVTGHAGLSGSAVFRPGLWEWAVGAAEFFRPLGTSRNVLGVPATVLSGSCLYLIYSLLVIWSLSKLRCRMPGLASLPRVCHLWMLVMVQMAVGGWSVLPPAALAAVAVSVTSSLQVVNARHERLGGLSWSSCFLQPCSCRGCEGACLEPGWDPWQMYAWCPGPPPAPSHCNDLCWDMCVERDPSPLFIPFFLRILNFSLVD